MHITVTRLAFLVTEQCGQRFGTHTHTHTKKENRESHVVVYFTLTSQYRFLASVLELQADGRTMTAEHTAGSKQLVVLLIAPTLCPALFCLLPTLSTSICVDRKLS
jgi:hypothetical protein